MIMSKKLQASLLEFNKKPRYHVSQSIFWLLLEIHSLPMAMTCPQLLYHLSK